MSIFIISKLTDFNSIKVRLKQEHIVHYHEYLIDFNSIKVRLKQNIMSYLIFTILISIP